MMFPELSVWKIMRGLIRVNFSFMVLGMMACWTYMLAVQCFYFGMDTTFQFEWIKCSGKENATWNGGFDWDC